MEAFLEEGVLTMTEGENRMMPGGLWGRSLMVRARSWTS